MISPVTFVSTCDNGATHLTCHFMNQSTQLKSFSAKMRQEIVFYKL